MAVPRGHVLVTFVKMVPPFRVKEQAALPFERAEKLVKLGAALYVTPPPGRDAAGGPKVSKDLPDGVRHKGGGYYVIGEDADGLEIVIKGRDEALEAFAALDVPDPNPDPDPDPDPDDEGAED